MKGESFTKAQLSDITDPEKNYQALFFQAGYLTIKDYIPAKIKPLFIPEKFTLGFPNQEVRYGFWTTLYDNYLLSGRPTTSFDETGFIKAVETGDPQRFMERLQALFSELSDDDILNFDISAATGTVYGFTYRIINEDTGEEISGASNDEAAKAALKAKLRRVSAKRGKSVDISALSDGNIILIVNALNEDGSVASVKTARLVKESNSAVDEITIEIGTKVDVYSINGALVRSQVEYPIEQSGLASGVYLIKSGDKAQKLFIP